MQRRTFLTALPLGAASLPFLAGTGADAQAAAPSPPGPINSLLPETQAYPGVRSGDRPVGASFGTRSTVFGRSGAAGTIHPLATLTGIEMLKKGGSAVDAAIAINACLGFLEPPSCGIGGDLYAMLWDPKAAKVIGIAGSGKSPRSLSVETVRTRARNGVIPATGAIAVSVPGTVDAWWRLHQRYGKLPWSELFEPAIAYAEQGAPVPPVIAYQLRSAVTDLSRPGAGIEETGNLNATYAPSGATPATGALFRNPDLARTYRLIAAGGRDAFYEGPVARTIDAYFKRIGGWLSYEDMVAHRSQWTEPLMTTYRGVGVHALGENTQGIATLQILNILERFDMTGAGFQSPLSIHLQAEAKRLAFEDRARFYADPDFADVPTAWLTSKAYAAERATLIRPHRVMDHVRPGEAPAKGDTTYFCVADADGMMVSMIQSLYDELGSGLVPDGLGFPLQNRGRNFSLQEGHPNAFLPGKRPFQTIIPGFATRGTEPWMAFGVMGGAMQPQGQAQFIVNRIDYGLDAQAAGDAPRWRHISPVERAGQAGRDLEPSGILHLETGVPDSTKKALADRGWRIGESNGSFGRFQCVEYRTSEGQRVYGAASDMRGDGTALAY